jgi:hypothetical protein
MRWVDTTALGSPGFIQSRLFNTKYWEENHRTLAEIELHDNIYYISFPHVKGVEYIRCKSLEEAKAVAVVQARFHQADQLTN